MKNKAHCPIESCGIDKIPRPFRDGYKDVQHHLWQYHHLDVIESHRLAATVAKLPRPRAAQPMQSVRKVDPKEFLKKQLAFDFGATR